MQRAQARGWSRGRQGLTGRPHAWTWLWAAAGKSTWSLKLHVEGRGQQSPQAKGARGQGRALSGPSSWNLGTLDRRYGH